MACTDDFGDRSKTTSDDTQDDGFEPTYAKLLRAGALEKRARLAEEHLEDCDLCARFCHVNRRKSIKGAVCRTGEWATRLFLWSTPWRGGLLARLARLGNDFLLVV